MMFNRLAYLLHLTSISPGLQNQIAEIPFAILLLVVKLILHSLNLQFLVLILIGVLICRDYGTSYFQNITPPFLGFFRS